MTKKIIIFLIVASLSLSGFGCKGLSATQQAAIQPITLDYWRTFDDADSMSEIIAAYKVLHPNITINYRKLLPEEFQQVLLDALAEDRGPDMFSIQNTWVKAYQPKIYPMPVSVKASFQRVTGTIQKQTVVDIVNTPTPTNKQVQDKYIGVVAGDILLSGVNPQTNQVSKMTYGLPLAVDTLALYYNKDLLDQAGIPEPPKTWEDFIKDVKLLTKLNSEGKILQSGASLGLSKNVTRSADILSLLMMQNGAKMTNDGGYPTFQLVPQGYTQNIPPANQALQFYTDFAQPTKEVYSWNKDMPESFDSFVRGQSAFFFGYAYHLPLVRSRAPKLNFNIVPVPQVNNALPTNFASYWVETVAKKTTHPDEAWDFILFATNAKNVVSYLNKTKKPTALRELVASQVEDPDIGVFASEVLTAKSWYKGRDAVLAEKYFLEMIDSVFSKEAINDPEVYMKAVNTAAAKIGQTM